MKPLYLVDAFSAGPFTGNPAGVCILDSPADDGWMQRVAMEMNQAETAFVYPLEDGFSLRWFTPSVEVDLCGHATLATSHILFGLGHPDLRFHTRSGVLTARLIGNEIELDFPSEGPTAGEIPHSILSLGVEPVWTGRNRMDWFIQLPTAEAVRAITPDYNEIHRLGMRGLIVTAQDETGEYDFVSRCFFPQSGVDEDPVTGSAHCAFAPFWAERLGRTELRGYQASTRGGAVGVEVVRDRVKLRGRAVTTLKGEILV